MVLWEKSWTDSSSLSQDTSATASLTSLQLLHPLLHLYNGVLTPILGIEPAPYLQTILGGDMWFLKYLFVMSLICYTLKKGLRRDWLVLVAILILFSVTRTGIFRLLPLPLVGLYDASSTRQDPAVSRSHTSD